MLPGISLSSKGKLSRRLGRAARPSTSTTRPINCINGCTARRSFKRPNVSHMCTSRIACSRLLMLVVLLSWLIRIEIARGSRISPSTFTVGIKASSSEPLSVSSKTSRPGPFIQRSTSFIIGRQAYTGSRMRASCTVPRAISLQ